MKKKIVYINVVCNGSTGKIMCDTALKAEKEGYETYCFYGRGNPKKNINAIKIGNKLSILFHVLLARFGFNGHGSYFATKKLIKNLRKINPDIIHMHNIHGYYLNLKVLFKYLKNEYNGKIIWMLHDCWAFTGYCSYFSYVDCKKWQNKCYKCPQKKLYPKEFIDTSKREYKFKKKLFTGLNNLTLVTPSNWLKKVVEKSFLKEYPVKAIHNGINLDIFKPIDNYSVYKKYNIPKNKKILLGVANIWETRKGFDVFLELSKIIKEDEIIILVGLNDKQLKDLPENIIGIIRTENQEELAELYSLSDVFINPSYEETFSLVTVEAMACGTPVVVCGLTAPKELVTDEVGVVVNEYSAQNYYDAYKKVLNKKITKDVLVSYVEKFSNEEMTNKNIELYKEN